MDVDLAFGRQGLRVTLPADADPHILRKPASGPVAGLVADPEAAVLASLESPIGCADLVEMARGAATACILICDITRPVPNALFLRPMIERLVAGGVPLTGITVLVATGLHRPNLGEELAELVGDRWVLDAVTVANHDARDRNAHVELGVTTAHAVPVSLDRRFVEADVKIATGLVEPHFMAGYSGGRKVIAPGIAFHETIRIFHSARFMEHPLATSCSLEGNPLHEAQLEIVAMLDGPILGFHTVLDEQRNLTFASFGEIIASHEAAVTVARRTCEVRVGRRFGTVLTSSAGYPLDKTYYQTVKGMVTPLDILDPGGTLIIVSECSEGLGSPEFREAQARLVAQGPGRFLAALQQKSLADIDEWQTEMQLKPMRVGHIQLYAPNLGAADRAVTGVDAIEDVAAAVAASIERSGDAAMAVIPEGPYLVPFAGRAA